MSCCFIEEQLFETVRDFQILVKITAWSRWFFSLFSWFSRSFWM